ncbi:hypothetical protein EUA78_00400 [TM7 phylum sp. oral taxon 351]|nr:hypothetical protein EUA78_00400 [TM7 phylum sp. oral taxon 351]
MNEQEQTQVRPSSHPRGRMIDFAPKGVIQEVSVRTTRIVSLSDAEQRRREIAKREIARREAIHRQIEQQKEQDLINQRRAAAAKRDLARRIHVEQEQEELMLLEREAELKRLREAKEKAERRAMMEAKALRERNRILLERREERARLELERRRATENKMPVAKKLPVKNPAGSKDPFDLSELDDIYNETTENSRYAVETPVENPYDKPANYGPAKNIHYPPVKNRAYATNVANTTDANATNKDNEANDIDDIDEIEERLAENNSRYVIGGHSPFINTTVEKRPLSGGNKTYEPTSMADKTLSKKPAERSKFSLKGRGRFIPYQEPLPHKNIYARTVAKEKKQRDVPTVVIQNVSKGSKISLIIAITLTVIFGATIGVIAYLALFQ